MKTLRLAGILLAGIIAPSIFSQSTHAQGLVVENKFFTKQKIYSDDTYVLNDYVEFSVFDMSKLNLFVNSQRVELKPQAPQHPAPQGAEAAPVSSPPPVPVSEAEKEIKMILSEIPKYFYKNLKNQILKQKIPLTLAASDAPAYARPLKLYVKLKKINLAQSFADKDGKSVQPVAIQIYGQLKDKKDDKVLTRFYDSEMTEFELGQNRASLAFDVLADKMMADLAAYLKTKY